MKKSEEAMRSLDLTVEERGRGQRITAPSLYGAERIPETEREELKKGEHR